MSSLVEASALEWTAVKRRNTAAGPGVEDEELFNITMHDVVSATSVYIQGVLSNVRDQVQSWRKRRNDDSSQQELLQDSAPWLQQLVSEHGYKQVMDHDALTAKNSIMPVDHLFRALASNDLVQDFRVLMCQKPSPPVTTTDPSATTVPSFSVVTVWQLGSNVCGHAGIVHGGMTAAMIDETFGYLLYMAKFQGLLDFKAVVTASLEVSYKMPLLPHKPVCVTTWVSSMQGRKIWLESVVSERPLVMRAGEDGVWRPTADASVADQPGSVPAPPQVFATSQALFVVPRAEGASSARLAEGSKGRTDTLDAIKPTTTI